MGGALLAINLVRRLVGKNDSIYVVTLVSVPAQQAKPILRTSKHDVRYVTFL
jgi:hypothetical protein